MSANHSRLDKKTGKQIQSEILRHIKSRSDMLAYKIEIANERGVPDLLCCVRGRFVGAEIKSGRDRPSAIQTAQARRIIEAGGKCFVIRSLDEFIKRTEQVGNRI